MNVEKIKKILVISMIIIASFIVLELFHSISIIQQFTFWNLIDYVKAFVYNEAPIIGFYGIILILEDIYHKIPVKSDAGSTVVKGQEVKVCPKCKNICKTDAIFCNSCGSKLP